MSIRFPDITKAELDADLDAKAERVPIVVADGDVFAVPADTQVLFAEAIELEGDAVLELEGDLVEVS